MPPSSKTNLFAILASLFLLTLTVISHNQIPASVVSTVISTIPERSQLASLEGTDSGLVGWWKFDEGSGTVAGDSSGNNNNGTLVNNPTWVTGKMGGAVSLDGVDDYVDIGDINALEGSTYATWSFWVKPTYSDYNSIFFKKGGSAWTISIPNSGLGAGTNNLRLIIDGASSPVVYTTAVSQIISNNVWQHFTIVYDGTQSSNTTKVKIYKNGIRWQNTAGVGSIPTILPANTINGTIGAASNGVNGIIDDVRIYNRALSEAEVTNLYNGIVDIPPLIPPELPTTYTLSVSKSGTGTGVVSGSLINCGSVCSQSFDSGTSITLIATPDSGTDFTGWSGGNCTGTGNCTVVLSANTVINSNFTLKTVIPLEPPVTTTNTYWVSPIGTAVWTACKTSTPLNGTAACSLYTVNGRTAPGDTIYLRGGTYIYTSAYSASIIPGYPPYYSASSSGTAEKPITYTNYNNEEVIFDGNNVENSIGIKLAGNYIKINGIHLRKYKSATLEINGGSYNELSNIIVEDSTPPLIHHNAKYNWIHNSTFSKKGSVTGSIVLGDGKTYKCYVGGILFKVGSISGSWRMNDFTSYNLFENNTFYHGGHDLIEVSAPENIFRNNYWHNEDFMPTPLECGNFNGLSGNRLITDFGPNTFRNIYENNRVGYSGIGADYRQGGEGIELTGAKSIVRYNYIFKAKGAGVYAYNKGLGGVTPEKNYIYSNTIYRNGYDGMGTTIFAGIQFSNVPYNRIKNNIIYDNLGGAFKGNSSSNQTYANNWIDSNGDPSFVNQTFGSPFDQNIPNLRLQSNSGAINKGGALTVIGTSDNGSGTNLIVDDAGYFQDGSFGPFNQVKADWIAIGTVDNIVQISSINYSTNVITLKNSINRKAGDSVWLYKDSSGNKVLHGSAPDIGAYEYPSGGTPPVIPPIIPPLDTTPPIISSINTQGITVSGATITFTTNEPSTTQIEYGLTTTYGNTTALISTLNTSHTQSITNLSSDTLYHYRVISKDSSGNTTTSPNQAFTTLKPVVVLTPDVTPPTVSITSPTGGTIKETITLSATALDPISPSGQTTSGLLSVQFKLDGINLGPELNTPTTGTIYSGFWNTLGISNGVHTLTAIARDIAGNTKTSDPITVTVNNVITPTETPTITNPPTTPPVTDPTTPPTTNPTTPPVNPASNPPTTNNTQPNTTKPSVGTFTPAVKQKIVTPKAKTVTLANTPDNSLSTTESVIDITVPKIPSWKEVIINLITDIFNKIRMGIQRTLEMVGLRA